MNFYLFFKTNYLGIPRPGILFGIILLYLTLNAKPILVPDSEIHFIFLKCKFLINSGENDKINAA